jgi:hypothetical protein
MNLNLNFFVHKDSEEISAESGVYAFFVPLRVHAELGVVGSIEAYRDLLMPDSENCDWSAAMGPWMSASGSINLAGKGISASISEWAERMEEEEVGKVNEVLYSLSILMPPIYVGMTLRSFATRYSEHVKNVDIGDNDLSKFRNRFQSKVEKLGCDRKRLQMSVSDLIFATLPIDLTLTEGTTKNIETIAHILGRPALSRK